jgi:hypothetical protein
VLSTGRRRHCVGGGLLGRVRCVVEKALAVDSPALVLLVEGVRNECVVLTVTVGTVRAGPDLLGLQLAQPYGVSRLLATTDGRRRNRLAFALPVGRRWQPVGFCLVPPGL